MMHHRLKNPVATILVTVILFGHFAQSQQTWSSALEIQENNNIDALVGFIQKNLPVQARPPYTFLSPSQKVFIEQYFTVNLESGEIKAKVKLDREENETYSFALLKNQIDFIQVNIKVTDLNDNKPRFINDTKYIQISENAPHYKISLGSAVDSDIGMNTIQSYEIISGNVDYAFNISGRMSGNQILLIDLGINGTIDYEITKSYTLIIRVYDGGNPRLYGDMTVNITIIDTNDNQPIFNQSKYSAALLENATVGKSVIEVFATDLDSGDNGRVSYYIDHQNSDPEEFFAINLNTGIVTLQKRVDYEVKTSHKLIVIARDHGTQPLQTSVFIEIEIININELPANIDITFLTNQTGRIREDASLHELVARISVSDPDATSDSNSDITVRLEGGEGYFGLVIRDHVVYLIVNQTLDREKKPWFNLTVVAVDSGTPPLFQSQNILLTVDDVNDNKPIFSENVYEAEIDEMSPNGSSVVQVTASDRDIGENARITYSINDDTDRHSDWFQIDINSGLITTHGKIDCEVESRPQLIVVARDSGMPQLSSSATVVVSVLDINDKEPMFDQSLYSAAVPESRTVGSCILQVNATDPDCGVNGQIHFYISNDTAYTDTFSIDPISGKLCIKKPLDFEKVQIYDFPIIAVDIGNFDTTAHVQITVTDVNDNSPIFYPLNYSKNVDEGTSPGSEIITVKATDLDSGANGTVTYNISSGNSEGKFRINETTGVISLVTSLPSGGKLYILQVVAKDGGGQRSTQPAEVQISVPEPGSHPPVFERSLYRIHVTEDIAPQASIGVVKATTTVPTTEIEYSITAGDRQSFFRIDLRTGELFTTKLLDHDEYPSLLLNILARTGGSTPVYGTTQVNITIEDVNDNPPIFSSFYIVTSISESIDSSTVIYVARATDKDSRANGNGEVRYRLGVNSGSPFYIDPTSGEVRLAQGMKLDYETVKRYEITIIAYDQGKVISLSSNMTLIISVQDANDNVPVFSENLYQVSVRENTSINTKFKQISATDRDSGENGRITFSLLSAQDSSKFGIFPSDGYLYLKEELDREVKDRFVLTIMCQDHGSPSKTATAIVTIIVTDINDNDPVFTQISYSFRIEENLPVSSLVGYISATDADIGLNAELVYSIPNGEPFIIKQNQIQTTVSLNREEKAEYHFNVVVNDRGDIPRQTTASVVILVTDTNDNKPVFVNSRFTESVDENKPKGTRVVQIIAKDDDYGENATITFSLQEVGDETALKYFAINTKTGWITTKEVLDYETKNVFNVSIVAADGGTPPNVVSHPFEIRVRDDNDEAPIFSTYNSTFYIEENIEIGSVVGQVEAYDKDGGENGRVSYYIIAGNTFGLFAVDHKTGEITTIREIDYEESSSHSVGIKAVDNSVYNPKSNTISVSIHIIDLNDNAPVFDYDPLFLKVRENSGIGQIVHIFTATDADSGRNGTVSYQIQNLSAAGYFALDQANGQLKVSQVINYETVQDISLVVKAFDGAPNPQSQMVTTLTVMILILDENDNAPVFQNIGTLEVSEDEPIGFLVTSLIAVDIDSNVNNSGNNVVSYTMQSGNEDGMFSLNTKTGQFTITKQLDRESVSQYSLVIGATDHGTPARASTITLTIRIMDVNDNSPHFLQSIYKANVSEDTSAGSFVTTVRATDPDQGVNQELSYMIPEGIADDKFVIDPNTGVITTQAILDRESRSSYIITVYVRDKGYPVQYDMSTLIVNVTDVNDHPPVFKEKRYTIEVPENMVQEVLYTFAAHDADIGINGQFTYSITAGNSDNKFSIHPTSGNLGCTRLDRELVAEYTLTVTASDRGNPTLSSSCIVVIRVLDQNDNDPKFSSDRYSTTLIENVAIGVLVLAVSATDPDQGSNGNVTYALNNDTDAGLFRIDINTGVITTSGWFDREKKSSYSFDVIASDGGQFDRRTEKVRVDIIIGDFNDNAPVFKEVPYTKNVSQGTPSGQTVLTVRADDKDEGSNGKVTYSISPDTNSRTSDLFNIEPLSGNIKTTQTLGINAVGYHNLKVIARDQGNTPLSSTGVVEITVGSSGTQTLSFSTLNYQVDLNEDSPFGSSVIRVQATYHGTGNISYSFASGNQNNAFKIDSGGLITVNNSDAIDFESDPIVKLIVAATVTGNYAYTTVTVNLQDANDNAPKFTQDRYVSAVWEEMPRNTFVTQVVATDADTGRNAEITYSIKKGNVDNAFIIDSPYSGIVKTNLVIDYEFQSSYKLEIEAVDNGDKVLSSTCTLKISVVNINDNPPKFPPKGPVNVSEDTEVGSVIDRVTANDVDQNPAVTYNFTEQGNPDNMFSIDLFSGQIRLAKALDHERRRHYTLGLQASDTVYVDYATLDIYVTDENDNAPEFSQQSYQVTLEELTPPGRQVMRVNATDADSGVNAQIRYKLGVTPSRGFYINSDTGVIYTNETVVYQPNQEIVQLVVIAEDRGTPSLSGVVAVHIQITSVNKYSPEFDNAEYRSNVSEDAERGFTVLRVFARDMDESGRNKDVNYEITVGNDKNVFGIQPKQGNIVLNGVVDRETVSLYNLTVVAKDRGSPPRSSSAHVRIEVLDVNDQVPVFDKAEYQITLSEGYASEKVFLTLTANDSDIGKNADIYYSVTSGNDDGLFIVNGMTGEMLITPKAGLDYESHTYHKLIVRAMDCKPCSQSDPKLSSFTTVLINVTDVNEFSPKFPIQLYFLGIDENLREGAPVYHMHANDGDTGPFGRVEYTLTGTTVFSINNTTGLITANVAFDYESDKLLIYNFTVKAKDAGNLQTEVPVLVNVLDVDEYTPVFANVSSQFKIAGNAKRGTVIGKVSATDEDGGEAGHVVYRIIPSHDYFQVDMNTGEIIVSLEFNSDPPKRKKRSSEDFNNGEILHRSKRAFTADSVTLTIKAYSGMENSRTATTDIKILIDRTCDGCKVMPLASPPNELGVVFIIIIIVVILAIILVVVIVLILVRNRYLRKKAPSRTSTTGYEGDDTDFDFVPTANGPPPYGEQLNYSNLSENMASADMSPHSHNSGSSGHGSVEEDEDEEISRINSNSAFLNDSNGFRKAMQDSGIPDDDNASEPSVLNHQEYLARLGIDNAKINSKAKSGALTHSVESMHQFSEEGGGECDGMEIGAIDYTKLDVSTDEEVAMIDKNKDMGFHEPEPQMAGSLSSVINSEEEYSGSYNWDYLLDWGPQYQPLAHVFAEIARLKDDSLQPKKQPVQTVPQSRQINTSIQPPVRMVPPPIITNAPPMAVSQPSSRSNQSIHSNSSIGTRTSTINTSLPSLPRSPISHESSFTSPALTPSFTPSLSPLATRSPSISPVNSGRGMSNSIHSSGGNIPRGPHIATNRMAFTSSSSEQELQI